MKNIFNIFLMTFLLGLTASCTQDLYPEEGTSTGRPSDLAENEYEFNLLVEDAGLRSRAVDFSPTGALRINQVWMGVFDLDNGKCVAKNTKNLDYKTIQSGKEHPGLVRIVLDKPTTVSTKGYVMVAIANYLGVIDQNGDDLEVQLMSDDLTWKKFNEIAVDAATAYASPHNGTTPVLAGFVYQKGYDATTHIKIDQFAENAAPTDNSIMLSPSYLVPKITVTTNEDGYDTYEKMTLKLRRLVANIKVNIQLTDKAKSHLILTDVSYKRYNMPKNVYIIERRTTDCTNITEGGSYDSGSFAAYNKKENSPNFSDLNPSIYYYNDADWQYGNVTGFSFQHFANKHWARKPLTRQSDREVREKYGENEAGENLYYYDALVDPDHKSEDFNNYASYFVIKMHLTDMESGRALEAEYTVHEGNTSDELGNPKTAYRTDDQGRIQYDENGFPIVDGASLMDFSVARNIEYNYNIYIDGVDHIYHNVNIGKTEGDENDPPHYNGQGGRVWEIHYANDKLDQKGEQRKDSQGNQIITNCYYDGNIFSFENAVPHEGGTFENAIKITRPHPDIAFRLYGYVKETGHIEGYNYNFPQESFSWLNGLWPPSAGNYSRYFKDYFELIDHFDDYVPEDLRVGLRIVDADTNEEMDLASFVESFNKASTGELEGADEEEEIEGYPKYYHIKIQESDISKQDWVNRNNYVRAIYIADRIGELDKVDGCTRLVNIFAAAQYPELGEKPKDPVDLPFPNNISEDQVIISNVYNIIDPVIPEFSLPILGGFTPKVDYDYRLSIGNVDYSRYGELRGNYYYYNIPMSEFQGTGGDVTLQVISKNEAEYRNSVTKKIGNITLKNHAIWQNGDGEDWTTVSNELLKTSADADVTSVTKYLQFLNGKFKLTSDVANGIQFRNNSSCIRLKVYKPCTIKVKAHAGRAPVTENNNEKDRLDFYIHNTFPYQVIPDEDKHLIYDDDSFRYDVELEANKNDAKTYDFKVTEAELKDGMAEIEFARCWHLPKATGICVISIQVTP